MSFLLQAAEGCRSLSRRKAILGETALVLGGQAASALAAIVGVRILTSILPPSVFGEVALSLTFVTIVQYCYAGTTAAAMRFYTPAVEQGQFRQYVRAAWRMQHARVLFMGCLVLVALLSLYAAGRTEWLSLAVAVTAIAVASSYASFLDGMQNAARHRAIVAVHQGGGAWLRLACAALLVFAWGDRADAVLWGFALAPAIVLVSQYACYRRIARDILGQSPPTCTSQQDWYVAMTSQAWPYLVWAVPAWLQLCSDRWALEWFGTYAEVGVYAALYQLAFLPVNTATQLLNQLASPILFACAGDLSDPARVARSRTLNGRLVHVALAWTVAATVLVALLQDPIASVFLDPRYRGFQGLLVPLVLSAGLFAAGQFAQLALLTENQAARLIVPKVTVAALGCGAFAAGAYLDGIAGVAWAGVVPNVVLLIVVLRLGSRGTAEPESSAAAPYDLCAATPRPMVAEGRCACMASRGVNGQSKWD